MVIDASKGVEAQTIKLFKVCVMRHIPIFTFINKLDREANDPFDLMDEIERVLGIKTCRITQTLKSLIVCASTPFEASITITAESAAIRVRYVSSEKS